MAGWDGKGLVSTGWLAENLGDPALRLFDVTVHLRPATPGPYLVESGRTDYEAAHIPGAAFLDLVTDLSDTTSPFHFTRPSLPDLARALGAAGVGTGLRIVAYSSASPMWATRFWWMLRALPNGRQKAAPWRPAPIATPRQKCIPSRVRGPGPTSMMCLRRSATGLCAPSMPCHPRCTVARQP